MITPETLTDEMVRALNPEMTAIHVANQSPMSPAQHRVLVIAIRDGGWVVAGNGAHRGHVERIAASPIRALIARGFLVHCYSSEGGYAGRLSPRTKQRICDAINARAAAQAPSDLAHACIQLGMTLSEEERAGFRAYADNAQPAGSTLARSRSEEAWEQGYRDAASATGHKAGCDCTTCSLVREESVWAQARTP